MKFFVSLFSAAMLFLVGCGEVGSEKGAGGSGPGYDGSGQGTGKEGTVPAPGSGVGSGLTDSTQTNPASLTNSASPSP